MELQQQIDEISRTPVLLVATDYDGTLAPIVNDPALAEAHRESLVAIKALSAMPQTHVAIISGRSLADLAKHVPEAEEAHLVGSHGSEFETGFTAPLTDAAKDLHKKIVGAAKEIAGRTEGALVEVKPAGVAFHYRNAKPEVAAMAVKELLSTLEQPGVHMRQGKMVVELSVVRTDKGKALAALRQRLGATAVVFLGDDVTDEEAFVTMTGPDMAVKVGGGTTTAKHRVGDTMAVAHLLAGLAERRAAWLAGSEAVPIERHALLSDLRTCVLVTPHGRITWLCLPRIDSPALFAELLGGPVAGFFDVHPIPEGGAAAQHYVDNTFVLRTRWDSVQVTDYLDCSAGRPHQRAGRTDLIRVIERRTENARVRLTFAPRLDFGGMETRLRAAQSGIVIEGAVDPCVLYSPGVRWTIHDEGRHQTAVAELTLDDKPLVLEMRYGTANLGPSPVPEDRRRQQTARSWEVWAAALQLPARYSQEVLRSALVLRALCYGPTGAIAAAATTSLPEHAGGVRNWDYRFCWPRDAAMAAMALTRLEAPGPAMRLLDWILGIQYDRESTNFIRPVYSVTGSHLGSEGVIGELAGYRGSRPVRVGNSAAHQVQLDVLGPIAELLALLANKGASLTQEHWRLTESMVAAVAARWREADHGIWEIRGSRQQHVHSKVSCWKTVDAALRVAENLGRTHEDWQRLRDEIAADVLAHGWNAARNAFCATYGGSDIDAAALAVGLSGLLPADDPRFAATVTAVEQELREGPTVYRYRYDDGLPGIEGGFNICTSWLIEAYAMLGRRSDAEELFAQYIALAGPTGLMAEEYDPLTRQALGNFPQAYSHIGLINCALRLGSE